MNSAARRTAKREARKQLLNDALFGLFLGLVCLILVALLAPLWWLTVSLLFLW